MTVGAIATAVTAVVVAIIIIAWGSSPESSPDDRRPRVVVVNAAKVLALPTEADSRLVLSGKEKRIVVGDFVTTTPDWEANDPHAPEGFLLEVKRSTFAHGVTTVTVEPASLFEAEPEGKLSTADSRFSSVESAAVEESIFSPLESHAVEPLYSRDALATTSEVPTPLGEVEESLKKTFGCGSSGRIEVEGKVDTSLEPKVKLDWSKRGRFSVSMDYAAAWAKGEAPLCQRHVRHA